MGSSRMEDLGTRRANLQMPRVSNGRMLLASHNDNIVVKLCFIKLGLPLPNTRKQCSIVLRIV